MTRDYRAIALEMNRLICIGEGHLASDLLLDAIQNDNNTPANHHTDYLLSELNQIQKQITTLTTEIERWKTK
jgi:hypothetical protein